MKTAQWSTLRLQMHARRQRITNTLSKLRGPGFEVVTRVVPLTTGDGHPITRDGEPVTEVREERVLTARGAALAALNLLDLSRRAMVRGNRQRRAR